MDVNLIALAANGTRKIIRLTDEVTTIGRQTDCSLHIPLGEISRQHCQVILEKNVVSVKDLGSSNGTFVNDQRIVQQDLKAGDVLSLAGAMTLAVQIDGLPAEIDESVLRRPEVAKDTDKVSVNGDDLTPDPAQPFSATSAGFTPDAEADLILSESFFLDDEEEED